MLSEPESSSLPVLPPSVTINQNVSEDTWQTFYQGPVNNASAEIQPTIMLLPISSDVLSINVAAPMVRFTSIEEPIKANNRTSTSPTVSSSSISTPKPAIPKRVQSDVSAGIAVTVVLVIVTLSALAFFCRRWWRRRRRAREPKTLPDDDSSHWKEKPKLPALSLVFPSELPAWIPPVEMDHTGIYEADSKNRIESDATEIHEADSKAISSEISKR